MPPVSKEYGTVIFWQVYDTVWMGEGSLQTGTPVQYPALDRPYHAETRKTGPLVPPPPARTDMKRLNMFRWGSLDMHYVRWPAWCISYATNSTSCRRTVLFYRYLPPLEMKVLYRSLWGDINLIPFIFTCFEGAPGQTTFFLSSEFAFFY